MYRSLLSNKSNFSFNDYIECSILTATCETSCKYWTVMLTQQYNLVIEKHRKIFEVNNIVNWHRLISSVQCKKRTRAQRKKKHRERLREREDEWKGIVEEIGNYSVYFRKFLRASCAITQCIRFVTLFFGITAYWSEISFIQLPHWHITSLITVGKNVSLLVLLFGI